MFNKIKDVLRRVTKRWDRRTTAEGIEQLEQGEATGRSQVEVAEQTEIPRSTLRYWKKRKASIEGASRKEVDFFESPEGVEVLHKICTAAHFIIEFTPRQGIRGVCEFLELSGLSRYVASSYGAQQKVASAMEAELVRYGEVTEERLAAKMPAKKITVCQDETFHPEVCLVGIEPVSNFILLEEYAEKRDAKTWNARMAKVLANLTVKVIQSSSDEGKGLLAHVRKGLGAHHSPDLFHPLREIGKGLFPRLNANLRRARRAKEAAVQQTQGCRQGAEDYQRFPERSGPDRPRDFQKHIETAQHAEAQAQQAVDQIEVQQDQVREALQGISDTYHPFDLKTGQIRSVETVQADIQQHFAKLDGLASAVDLAERGKAYIDKARRLVPQFVATLAFVFRTLRASVEELALPEPAEQIIQQHLIPGIYLQTVAAKAATSEKRQALAATAETLLAPLRSPDNPLASLPRTELEHIERVAIDCANLFQRSSSCVEGRNGQLALWHHHLHKLRPRKLRALTVVHNYFTRRPDGQTPAQRFFSAPHEDLFAWLLDHMRPPPRPARRRPRPPPQPLLAGA